MRGLFKLLFVALMGLFALVFLVSGLVAVMVMAVLSLLTGRKPAIFSTYSAVKNFSQQFGAGAFGSPVAQDAANDNVVDVQAHEVRPALMAPSTAESPRTEPHPPQ